MDEVAQSQYVVHLSISNLNIIIMAQDQKNQGQKKEQSGSKKSDQKQQPSKTGKNDKK